MGNRDPDAAPSGCYRCQGQDRWVTIAVSTEAQWRALITALGYPPWASDERFHTKESRLEHQDELDSYISEWTCKRDNIEVMKLCQKAGVPAGAVLHIREVMTDEHYLQRGTFEVVQCPPPPDGVGTCLHVGPPWKLSKTPADTSSPAPAKLGQDNDYVYRRLLGLTDEELSELEAEGIISTVVTKPLPDGGLVSALMSEYDKNYLEILGLELPTDTGNAQVGSADSP
jgi:crotonobetainyl-CoA:carnitine CoA-transferase CaiB-like acyl-CoA transferase